MQVEYECIYLYERVNSSNTHCMYVYECVCMYMYACMCVCMYVCMYVCGHVDWYGAATRLSVERGVRLRHVRTQDEHDALCTYTHTGTGHHHDER